MSVVISEDFRKMTIPSTDKILGCVGDKKIRDVEFVLPRYCDNNDMADYQIQVHYQNAKEEGDYTSIGNVEVKDDTMIFVWEPPRLACAAKGTVIVNIKAINNVAGQVQREFNSGFGRFKVKDAFTKDPQGSPLVDSDGDLIVVTVQEDED